MTQIAHQITQGFARIQQSCGIGGISDLIISRKAQDWTNFSASIEPGRSQEAIAVVNCLIACVCIVIILFIMIIEDCQTYTHFWVCVAGFFIIQII